MLLSDKVEKLLSILERAGHRAFLVGGAVRDAYLNEPVYDHDVATDALPNEIETVFSGYKVVETGIKHGTVTVLFEGESFEITTFRSDGEYLDARHPESVVFKKDITEDLARRDFTINAIAVAADGKVVDPFGGVVDIKRRLIRTVGDPDDRFREDALRILRLVRLKAKTDFDIDEKTLSSAIKNAAALRKVSVERLFSELTKILLSRYATKALAALKEIVFAVIPELSACDGFDQKSLSHCYDVYAHTLRVVELLSEKTPITVWAALLHDIGKPLTMIVDEYGYGHFPTHMEVSAEIAENVLKRFKSPNELRISVVTLVKYHDAAFPGRKRDVKRFLRDHGEKMAKDLLILKFADIYAHSEYGINKYLYQRLDYESDLKEILENGECYSLKQLAIGGDCLIEQGFSGDKIGEVLGKLLDAVIDGRVPNVRDELIRYVKNNF